MVQGKRQLGFLYNDFVHSTVDKEKLKSIVQSAIIYSLDFEGCGIPDRNIPIPRFKISLKHPDYNAGIIKVGLN